jgi:hypothetical protein
MSDTVLGNIDSVLQNPVTQAGINVLAKSNPLLWGTLQLVIDLSHGWKTESDINEAVKIIDQRAAYYIHKLATETLHVEEQHEIEIRLHELLGIIVKLGGL